MSDTFKIFLAFQFLIFITSIEYFKDARFSNDCLKVEHKKSKLTNIFKIIYWTKDSALIVNSIKV